MCIFVAVGVDAPAPLMAHVFDEQAELDVGVAQACAQVAKIFPAKDQVRLVTYRGCSCDLLQPPCGSSPERLEAAKCALGFRRAVAELVRQVGSVRLLVHRHAGTPRQPCRGPHPRARFKLEVREFMTCREWFVEDVLMEVAVVVRPPGLVRS